MKKGERIEETLAPSVRSIEIGGKSIPVRRLNLSDLFQLTRILGVGLEVVGAKIAGKEMDAGLLGMLLISAIPNAEEDVYRLLSSILNLEIDEVKTLSPAQALEILEIVIEQEDIKDFFLKARRLAQKLQRKIS